MEHNCRWSEKTGRARVNLSHHKLVDWERAVFKGFVAVAQSPLDDIHDLHSQGSRHPRCKSKRPDTLRARYAREWRSKIGINIGPILDLITEQSAKPLKTLALPYGTRTPVFAVRGRLRRRCSCSPPYSLHVLVRAFCNPELCASRACRTTLVGSVRG
jgi:hypothetical protein